MFLSYALKPKQFQIQVLALTTERCQRRQGLNNETQLLRMNIHSVAQHNNTISNKQDVLLLKAGIGWVQERLRWGQERQLPPLLSSMGTGGKNCPSC